MIHHSFSPDDQANFAKLSGDYNPVHLDPIKARRTRFGQTVVHGVHALIWALDILFTQTSDSLKLVFLKTFFSKPIGVGQMVQFIPKIKDKTYAEIQILVGNSQALSIYASFLPRENGENLNIPDAHPDIRECLELDPEQLSNKSGSLNLCFNQSEITHRFPNLMQVLPAHQLAELLALTRLIGMECPGLNSIFSDLNLEFSNPCGEIPHLTYKVLSYDSRISLLTQNVQGPGMIGAVRAFIRPSPEYQSGYLELSRHVKNNEFSGQMALIIGGSRGLGEVTSKILAAGGARVILSYHLGSEEANEIVEQIIKGGGKAKCFPYDVLSPDSLPKEIFSDEWIPTHFYYFPTPLIFQGQKNSFSATLYQEFCDFYVTGFFNTFQSIQKLGDGLKASFYPSSITIDEPSADMMEYSAAKSAGETLCASLQNKYPNINIYSSRLPRTATDQTNSLLPSNKKDPVSLMLEILRNFRDR